MKRIINRLRGYLKSLNDEQLGLLIFLAIMLVPGALCAIVTVGLLALNPL